MLVDDDQFITVAYKTGLEQAGYDVSVARDGEQALTMVHQAAPDLMLLDMIMPKMNGFEVLQALRADELLAGLPVMVLTNLSQQSDEDEARGYGIVDFVVKADVSLRDLQTKIDSFFAQI